MYVFEWMYVKCISACRDQKGEVNLGMEIISGWEPPDMGAGNQTSVLWKNSTIDLSLWTQYTDSEGSFFHFSVRIKYTHELYRKVPNHNF